RRLDQGIETRPASPVRVLLVVESVSPDALSTGSFERKPASPRGEGTGIFSVAEAGSAAVQETVRLKVRIRLDRGPAGFLGAALQSLPLGPRRFHHRHRAFEMPQVQGRGIALLDQAVFFLTGHAERL